jgi:glutamine amidotransferase
MHNGFVGNWSRLRRKVEALIPDQLYPQRIGTTDTEAIFLAIMGAGIEHPLAATENVLQKLTDFVNQTKPADRLRVTAALSNGRDLYAFRYAVNDKANTLYYRESDAGLLIVSEPIDQGENWIAVPENHALVAPSGERARVVPLLHRHQVAAE